MKIQSLVHTKGILGLSLIGLLLASLLFYACWNPVQEKKQTEGIDIPAGQGTVRISIAPSSEREITPSYAFDQVTLSFKSNNGKTHGDEIIAGGASSKTVILDIATWEVSAIVYAQDGGNLIAVALGKGTVALVAGTPASLAITLYPVETGADGDLAYTVNLPASSLIQSAELAILEPGASSTVLETRDLTDSATGSISLAPGIYRVVLTVEGKGDVTGVATYSEYVYIAPHTTTAFSHTVGDGDFVQMITLSGTVSSNYTDVDTATLTFSAPGMPGATADVNTTTGAFSCTMPACGSATNFAMQVRLEYSSNSADTINAGTIPIYNDDPTTINLDINDIANAADFGFGVSPIAHAVANPSDWADAVADIINGGNNQNHVINLTGDVTLPGGTGYTFDTATHITVSIRGNHTMTLSSAGYILRVGASQTVIVRDIELHGLLSNTYALVSATNGGTLKMKGTAKIMHNTNESNSGNGGGVYVQNGAFFRMEGGEISDNTATNGGGVYVTSSTFWMEGGEISVNTATDGGGVYVYSGTFQIKGGTISGNTATSNGGGVYMGNDNNEGGSASVTMQGGEVSGNNAQNGGGVYVYSSQFYGPKSFFKMEGGGFTGNIATSNGGGVFISINSTFTMEGGAITNNTATNVGGGVYNHFISSEIGSGTGIFNILDTSVQAGIDDNHTTPDTTPTGPQVYSPSGASFTVGGIPAETY